MGTDAIGRLGGGFVTPFPLLGEDAGADRDAVVISWPSVPVEIVRAARFRPVFARSAATPTPAADAVLEAGVFPGRLRQLVEAALTGRLDHVAAIVLPRTSDADYKGFLYLRELQRQGRIPAGTPVLLYDLLQSAGDEVADYNSGRTGDLHRRLVGLARRPLDSVALQKEIRRADTARAAFRRLAALRRPLPRLVGVEALPLLGAFWQLPAERYAALAEAAADEIAARPPAPGPRVLLAGAPVDSMSLHVTIELRGAVVVDEISPYGNAGAGADVGSDGEPLAALAAKYRRDAIDARSPREALWRRLEQALVDVDAVVISLPADDASFGWDLPRLRAALDRRGLPHAVVDGDPATALDPASLADIDKALVAAGRRESRYG